MVVVVIVMLLHMIVRVVVIGVTGVILEQQVLRMIMVIGRLIVIMKMTRMKPIMLVTITGSEGAA